MTGLLATEHAIVRIKRERRRDVPTVLRNGPYRLFFYAADRNEPEHVHVERDNRVAKFWLDPVRLQQSGGLSRTEILRIERMIEESQADLLEAWHEFFDY